MDDLLPGVLERLDDATVPADAYRLAHLLLSVERHSGGHLPCPPEPHAWGCEVCWDRAEVWRSLPVTRLPDPFTAKAARDLITYWYGLGALTGAPLVFHGMPHFDERLVP